MIDFGQYVAPQSQAEANSWLSQITSAVGKMNAAWSGAMDAYMSMVGFRFETQQGPDEVWGATQDQSFNAMESVILTINRYLKEAKTGVRAVVASAAKDDFGIAGVSGETRVIIDNARIVFKAGDQERTQADQAEFAASGAVGWVVPIGIVVIVIAVGIVVAIEEICRAIRARAQAATDKAVLDHQKYLVDHGATPEQATAATQGLLNNATKQAEQNANTGIESIPRTLTNILWAVVGVAIVGGVFYVGAPIVRDMMADRRASRRLAA